MSIKKEQSVSRLTRREWIRGGVSLAAVVSCDKVWGNSDSDPMRAREHGNPLREVGYGDVTFAPGPHQTQIEHIHAVLMGLNEDSLLRPFRLLADLQAPGFELGGWYSSNNRDPGHAFGQWISALSRYYAITGDEKTREKVFRLLRGYSEAVEPSGTFFSRGYPKIGNISEASYTYDMLVEGLADAHEFARHPTALDVLSRVTDAALPHIPSEVLDGPSASDWGFMMPHNLFVAWQRGARADHLQIATKYLHHDFFDRLARGQNVLGGHHAYSHLDALNSATKAYLVLGDDKYLEAAVNGFKFVEQQSFATGGWGPSESFLPRPAVDYRDPDTGQQKHHPAIESLGDSLLHERYHFETGCGSYAHFKLTRLLLRITKDSGYGDSMERVMYNAALGVLPLKADGAAFYYSSYSKYARKAYYTEFGGQQEWPCCSGTLTQLVADYRISTYFRDDTGVYVNLYIPSTLRWSHGLANVSLTQAGDYPLSDSIYFTMETSRPVSFALRFRIPAWARQPVLRVNGALITQSLRPGSFAEVRRQWHSGDKVELLLPKQLELKAADDSDLLALCCGPLVLFAVGEDLPKFDRQTLLTAKQTAVASSEWRIGDVKFLPWWVIRDESYTTYQQVS